MSIVDLISRDLYNALCVAEAVGNGHQFEGPTTTALELAAKHKPLLRTITDEEIIKLSALVCALERGRLFMRHQELVEQQATQDAQQGQGSAGRLLDTLCGLGSPSAANSAPTVSAGEG